MGSEKKGGGGLDDLKARLGLDSVLSKARQEPPKPAAPPPGSAPAPPGDAAATGAAQPAPAEEVAPPPPDYSSAISRFEDPVAGEGEPDPVLTDSHKLVDLNLAVPVSRGAKIALVVVTLVAIFAALGAGYGFGKVMRDREVAEEVTNTVGRMADEIEAVAIRIREFQQALSTYPNEYSPELQELLRTNFEGGGPTLSARALADARIIMTTGEDLTRDLINYSISTQILTAMVQEHLGKSLRDRRLIESLLVAQDARPTNYGVVFSWDDASQRFREFYENPAETTFIPARGVVATFETLEMQTQNPDSENPVYQYPVLIGAQQQMVAIYNLIVVDADQFVTNPNEETALTRYSGRVDRIREFLATLVATQEILIEQLRARAAADS